MADEEKKPRKRAAAKPAAASKPAAARKPAAKPAARKPAARAAAPAVEQPVRRRPAKAVPATPEQPLTVSGFDGKGARGSEVQLPQAIFGETPNMAVMHQAYLRQVNNARQGTAATKTRGMVSGGGAKPYRQKGTGRARHGSEREPSMVGGGTVFGPKPRSFAQRMPKKMRRLALRSALSVKANEGKVSVVDGFDIGELPKTRAIVDLLRKLEVEGTALLVLPASNDLVQRSVNNLPWAKVVLARNLSLYDLFTHDRLVIARDALEQLEENFA